MVNRRGRPANVPSFVPDVKEVHVTRVGSVVRRSGAPDVPDFEYNFSIDGLSTYFQDAFANEFETQLQASGAWRTSATLKSKVNTVRRFAKFCTLPDICVNHAGQISVSILNDFRLYAGQPVSSELQRMLRGFPGLPPRTQTFVTRRIAKTFGNERSYNSQEMASVRSQIARLMGELESRIASGVASAHYGDDASNPGTVVAALLTGDQRKVTSSYTLYREACRTLRVKSLPLPAIRNSIFISSWECNVLVLALAIETGWNLTTMLELKTPVPVADPHNPKRGQYFVELEKRRRGEKDRFETRSFAFYDTGKRSDVLTRIISITAPLRRADTGSENHLFVFHDVTGTLNQIRQKTVFSTQYLERLYPDLRGLVSVRRLRRTVNVVVTKQPNQNSADTHMTEYVLRDSLAREGASGTILAGINEARSVALGRFIGEVELERDESGSKIEEAALAGCKDPTASPLEVDGGFCKQSFLACFGCSNAVLKIDYLPRNAALWQCLVELRTVIEHETWSVTWQPVLDRLEDLAYNHLSKQQWQRALNDVSEQDLSFVRMLLVGDLDA